MNSKEIAVQAMKELFVDKDVTAVDRWVSPAYHQHSTLVASGGREGLRGFVAGLPDAFRYEQVRVVADDDLVALHGIGHGFGPDPVVGFDLFRVEGGLLVEHWDAITPILPATVSGRGQTDGPTEISRPERTESSRAVVSGFVKAVLQGGDHEALADYLSVDDFRQHSPEIADGFDGYAAALATWTAEGRAPSYQTVHKVVAEGEFVLVLAEGEFGVPTAFYDLFRVSDDGKIAEHWDVVTAIPELHHDNGMF